MARSADRLADAVSKQRNMRIKTIKREQTELMEKMSLLPLLAPVLTRE